ncbi:hypothetical protein CDAR_412111 [Caerostris darwini]|uniref:Uncharacterized protein n=1 Tax=Caerostris darwini TaxID=1538125 RepID=A0AAV4WEJ2_9ARAC|nr:hypothetical protein CDAR_412111 [Caerostris darwini]
MSPACLMGLELDELDYHSLQCSVAAIHCCFTDLLQIASSSAEQKSKKLLMPERNPDKYTAGKIYNPDIRRKSANLVVRKSTSFYSDSSTVDKHIVHVRNKLHSEKPDIASFPTA